MSKSCLALLVQTCELRGFSDLIHVSPPSRVYQWITEHPKLQLRRCRWHWNFNLLRRFQRTWCPAAHIPDAVLANVFPSIWRTQVPTKKGQSRWKSMYMYIYIYSTYIIFRWTNICIYIMEMEIPPTHDIYLPDKWLIINSPIELDWAVFFSNLESHGFCKPYNIEIRSWEKTRTSSPIQHSCQGFGYFWRKLPSHVWCNCNCSYMSLQSTHVYTMPASFSIVSWLKADGNKSLAIH